MKGGLVTTKTAGALDAELQTWRLRRSHAPGV
jgi:hypothetical protein